MPWILHSGLIALHNPLTALLPVAVHLPNFGADRFLLCFSWDPHVCIQGCLASPLWGLSSSRGLNSRQGFI